MNSKYVRNHSLVSPLKKAAYKDGEEHGPAEIYNENGQLRFRGIYNMVEQCGEWIENDESRTHPPC